jgi:hypothetical protein
MRGLLAAGDPHGEEHEAWQTKEALMDDLGDVLANIVGEANVVGGDAVANDDTHDEGLTVTGLRPAAVVRPATTDEVGGVVALAAERGIPVTARGSGTGLSGGARRSRAASWCRSPGWPRSSSSTSRTTSPWSSLA